MVRIWRGLATAVCLLACGAAQAADKVSVGVVSALSDAAFYIAADKNYFRDAGIDVNFITFDSAAKMIAPLATGELDPFAVADDLLLPLEVAPSLGGGDRPSEGSALELSGAELSSLRRRDGRLELRIFNPSDSPTTARLPGRRGWVVDLRGRQLEPFEEAFELGPQRFATLRLSEEC